MNISSNAWEWGNNWKKGISGSQRASRNWNKGIHFRKLPVDPNLTCDKCTVCRITLNPRNRSQIGGPLWNGTTDRIPRNIGASRTKTARILHSLFYEAPEKWSALLKTLLYVLSGQSFTKTWLDLIFGSRGRYDNLAPMMKTKVRPMTTVPNLHDWKKVNFKAKIRKKWRRKSHKDPHPFQTNAMILGSGDLAGKIASNRGKAANPLQTRKGGTFAFWEDSEWFHEMGKWCVDSKPEPYTIHSFVCSGTIDFGLTWVIMLFKRNMNLCRVSWCVEYTEKNNELF